MLGQAGESNRKRILKNHFFKNFSYFSQATVSFEIVLVFFLFS
jgi:hypothetical protein